MDLTYRIAAYQSARIGRHLIRRHFLRRRYPYLAEWRRGSPISCSDDLVAEADNAVAEIEQRYDQETLKALVQQGGRAA